MMTTKYHCIWSTCT